MSELGQKHMRMFGGYIDSEHTSPESGVNVFTMDDPPVMGGDTPMYHVHYADGEDTRDSGYFDAYLIGLQYPDGQIDIILNTEECTTVGGNRRSPNPETLRVKDLIMHSNAAKQLREKMRGLRLDDAASLCVWYISSFGSGDVSLCVLAYALQDFSEEDVDYIVDLAEIIDLMLRVQSLSDSPLS